MKPKVIALCGPPGAGKSTIIRAVKSIAPACLSVAHDDFPNATAKSFAELKAWFERGCDPNEFSLSQLMTHLESMIAMQRTGGSTPVILFETPFGRLHQRTGALIDYLIWIDVPLDVALARQILAFSTQQHPADPSQSNIFKLWLENYLRSYLDMIAAMYRLQVNKIRETADLRIDGLQSTACLANLVLSAIKSQS